MRLADRRMMMREADVTFLYKENKSSYKVETGLVLAGGASSEISDEYLKEYPGRNWTMYIVSGGRAYCKRWKSCAMIMGF